MALQLHEDGNGAVQWTTSNSAVATVSSVGAVSAHGKCDVTITARSGAASDAATFRVVDEAAFEGDDPFAWLGQGDPFGPVWEHGRRVPHPDDPRTVIVLDETFTVPAGTEQVIANKVVWIRPKSRKNIEIFGHLRIQESLLLWDQTEHQQCRFVVKNGGVLDIARSYAFGGNPYWVNWEYESGAHVAFDRFVGDPWTSAHGSVTYIAKNYSTVKLTFLAGVSDSRVEITDAHHVWLEIFPPQGATVDLTLPQKRAWTGDLHVDGIWPRTTVSVKDSYLFERDLSLDLGVTATIRDTAAFGLGWSFSHFGSDYITVTLDALGDPDKDEGVYYADQTWNVPETTSSLRVVNSTLMRVWPVAFGKVHLNVFRSNLVDARVWGEATYKIHDSTIDHFAAYQGAKAYIEHSRVRYDIEAKDAGSVVYGFDVQSRDPKPFDVITVGGGAYTPLSTAGAPF